MTRVTRFPTVNGEVGWFEILKDKYVEIGSRLKSKKIFDVAIIGAGIAGISTANALAKKYPNKSIALIDALKIGLGTSSRCAGFIIDLPHNLDSNEPNEQIDKKIYELNCFAINKLYELVQQHNIECDWQVAGKYMCAHEESNIAGLDMFVKHLSPCGFQYTRLSGNELEAKLGTSYYKEAIYTPNNILLNPSALIRGLAIALPHNVEIFEQSPIVEISYGAKKVLKSIGGSIKCDTVVLSLDSYLEEFGLLKHRHAPIFTYGSLSEPLSDDEVRAYFKDIAPYGLTSAHPAGTTVRYTSDKRIFIRNVLDFCPSLTCSWHDLQSAFNQHRKSFESRFPHLAHRQFDYTWGGMLCMTLNYQGIFGKIADGVFAIGGSNGVGMAKGVYLGYYLADLIAGDDSYDLAFIVNQNKASYMPPDPLRCIGAKIRLRYEQNNAKGDI